MRSSIKNNSKVIKQKQDEGKFISIFENSLNAILLGIPDGTILEANNAAIEMFGYSLEELKSLGRGVIFDTSDPKMIAALKIREITGKSKGELIGIRKNGERFPCEFSSAIFITETGERRTSTVLNDITERKKSEEEIDLLLNNTEESFVLINLKLEIVSFNKQFKNLYKTFYNKDVEKGINIFDFAQKDRKEKVKNIYERVFKGEIIEDEIEVSDKEKGLIVFSIQYKPAFDNYGNLIGAFVTCRDITENKKIQQQIIINEKRFRSIIEHTGDLIVLTNVDGALVYISPSVEKITGFNAKDIINKSYKFTIHPDFLEDSKSIFEELLKKPGIPISRKIKILHKSGHFVWVEGVVTNLLHDKNVQAIVSNYRDITEKIANNQQKEFEKRDKEALINSTDDLIWSVSRDFKLFAGNKAFIDFFKKATGINLKPGDNVLELEFFPAELIVFWKKLYEEAFKGKLFKQEIYTPQFDNTNESWAETSINPIYDADEIIGVACYSRNITEKKIAQLKLNEKNELFEILTSRITAAIYQFEINPEGKMYFPYISKGVEKINPNIDIELLKKDASSAFATVHPDDLGKLLMSIETSKNNLTDWELEYRTIIEENKIVWIKGSSSPEKKPDGTVVWYGYLQDISEQKNNNEKIRISKERYDIIAKATNDTIWDWDMITNEVKWNQGIRGIFGYKNDTNLNYDWWISKIHPEDANRIKEYLEYCIKNSISRWENEYRFCCADGSYKYIYDRGFLVVNESVPVRMIGAMQDITERKQAEGKYRESERRFKTIFEAEPECVKLIGCKGELLEMNSAGLALLEVETIEQINAHSLIEFVLPEYRESFNNLHQLAMNGKDGWMELEIIGLLKTHRWLETKTVPIRDENDCVTMMLSVTRDITQRKQEEYHLKLLESVITNANDAVVITQAEPFEEPGPRIVFVNEAFTKMTGYSHEEVIGKSPRFLRGPKSDKIELKRLKEAMQKYEPCEITTINYKKNGEEFWVNLSVSPVSDEKGIVTHWISIERDITQRKYYELEREQIIAELSQNNKDLKQFSYVTSHNLRAPIANLLGLSSLIDNYKIPNKSLKQILDGIKQSALMFDETVKDLSQVLVIKDQTNITKEELSFVSIVDRSLAQLSITVDDNAVKINYEFTNAPTVIFTSSYLESIFINLFTNALKYKSNQRKLKIDIASEDTQEYVVVKFKDNGIGIDIETHREKLFKLYQRFHNNSDGKGLGLYLVKSQMEALGGTIDVESIVGKGTTFILKFKKYTKE